MLFVITIDLIRLLAFANKNVMTTVSSDHVVSSKLCDPTVKQ
ncbi:5069_t:CDS:2, partial [Gigaspora margarita]